MKLFLSAVFLTVAISTSALAQADAAAQLRASGKVGEQANGYLGIVGSPSPELRAQVDAINLKRRAYYTDLAGHRNAKTEEVAATTACELFRTKVGPGQYYRLPDGVWRQRVGNTPIALPGYCG
jgi:uncharacterized protein YdbL (DUF1318 family)